MNANLIGWLITGLGMLVLLVIGLRAERRTQVGANAATGLNDKLLLALAEIGDLRQTLDASNLEIGRLRMALDTANVEIGRLRAALDAASADLVRLRTTMSGSETILKRPIKPLLLAQCEQAFGDVDAQAIRRTGILLQRLRLCKAEDLDRALQTGREDGQTVWWLQISAHMSAKRVKFFDKDESVEWLSQRIRGVQVLFLAGCENEEIGAALVGANMAQHVISMTEPVESRNAADFTFAFWRAVAEGGSVPDAYEQALQICPQISEMVMLRSARRR